jgi:hypothetical protein
MNDLPGYFTEEDGNIHIKTKKGFAQQRCISHVFILLALFVCFSLFLISDESTGNQFPVPVLRTYTVTSTYEL